MTQVVPDTPLLVDARTAARLLNISPRSLYSLLKRGELPSVRVGSRRLFSPTALVQWIEQRLSTDPPCRRPAPTGKQSGGKAPAKAQTGQRPQRRQ